MTQRLKMLMLLGLSFFFVIFGAAQAARAAVFTVDTTADDAALTACTSAGNDCSLRGAIINANAVAGADTINFDAAVFSTAQTITLAASSPIQSLVINSDLIINGPGANLLTVKGYVNYGLTIFEISGGVVAINNLKLTGGSGKSCVDSSSGANVNTTCGGAVYMSGGTVTVSGSAFSGNSAGNGSAVYTRGGSLNVSGSTISNNGVSAYQSGGGIYTDGNSAVTITNSTVSDNIAGIGAGILVQGGTLSLANSTVSGNLAKNYTSTFTFQCPSFDYCYSPPPGTTCDLGTQICTRTVSNNGLVGGILNRGGTVNVTNSTVSGNTAQGYSSAVGYGGGGIDNRSYLTVANSTITNNYGQNGGGIINRGSLNLSNNIIAGNRASSGADVFNFPGATTSGNYNLVQNGDAFSGTGNITGVDAKLGALASNGGPTQTHALLQGSPAIDAGDPNFDATATPFDQRGAGFPRVVNGRVDIGAFEGYFYGVNTLTDHDDGSCSASDCTLREAVKYAPDGTTVNFGVTGTIILTGGEIAITKNLTISGPATAPGVTISGNNSSRIFYVNINNINAAFNVSNLTLTGGNGAGSGTSGAGGAIYVDSSSANPVVTITNSTISGNTAAGNAGGIRGGNATLIITNSTISGNTASGATSNGGGLRLAGIVRIANSTISGNTAANGGGIYYSYANPGYTLTLTNSIVAGNTATTAAPDISNSSNGSNNVAGNYNLVQNISGATLTGTHNITGQSAKLGALADNGGATKTMALLANSPALDAGDPNFDATATPFDQRGAGFARKIGSAIDVGAFEVQPAAAPTDLTVTKTHIGNFTQGDAGKTYTISVTNSGGTASNGTVSAIDTLPAGLTATAIGGAGWNCDLNSLTCTRSDALAAGASFPAISLTVNVASDAPASVINTAAVSGGGETNASNNTASDPTAVNAAPRYSISGTIRYGITPSGQPDSFVAGVNLNGTGTASASATSDTFGIYQLSNLPGGDYTVTPSKSGDIKGINSLDATRIQQHLVGITTLSANQLIAADTDGNGVANSLDAARIQQSLIGMPTANIIGQWKFVPGNRQYNALSGNQTGQDFAAILVGEVSGNWASAASFADIFSGDRNDNNAEEALLLETGNQNHPAERFNNYPFGQFPADTKRASDLTVKEAATEANVVADIQVSLPTSATGSNGSTVTIPITISQIPAGQSIESFDFSVFYNPAILQPTLTPGSNTGTLSANCSVLSNSPVSGRVIVSGACAQAITSGSGVLYNLTFTVIGAANQTSSLSFSNPATGINTFQFNNGTPTTATTNGSLTVVGPTAASVSVSGRILTPEGRGLMNAVVTMTDSTGAVQSARSSTFGYFHFENVAAGQTCVFQISSKRYAFAPQVLTIMDNVTELNFTAQ